MCNTTTPRLRAAACLLLALTAAVYCSQPRSRSPRRHRCIPRRSRIPACTPGASRSTTRRPTSRRPKQIRATLERVHAYVDQARAGAGDRRRYGRAGHGSHAPAHQRGAGAHRPADPHLRVGRDLRRHVARCAGHRRRALQRLHARTGHWPSRRSRRMRRRICRRAPRTPTTRSRSTASVCDRSCCRAALDDCGRDVRGADQGRARGPGRQEVAALDRQLCAVRVVQPVPARGRHAGAQPPAAELAVARRSLHERAVPRAGRKAHRRAALLRRRGETDPAVRGSHVRQGARACSCTPGCRT